MALYKKSSGVGGAWVKGSEVTAGSKVKIVSETEPQPSQFTDKNGKIKTQDVCKVRFQGGQDALNMSLNRATTNALVDAFGEDSKTWIGQVLTAHTEKVRVAGVARIAVYLLPDGYEVQDDENGYVQIVNPNKESIPSADENEEVDVSSIPF